VWPSSTAIEPVFLTRRHIAPIDHRARLVNVRGELGEEVMTKIGGALKGVGGLGAARDTNRVRSAFSRRSHLAAVSPVEYVALDTLGMLRSGGDPVSRRFHERGKITPNGKL